MKLTELLITDTGEILVLLISNDLPGTEKERKLLKHQSENATPWTYLLVGASLESGLSWK